MLTIKVTDKRKYRKIEEIDLSGASKTMRNNAFDGDVTIQTRAGEKTWSGQHGSKDWEDEFGFVVVEKSEA